MSFFSGIGVLFAFDGGADRSGEIPVVPPASLRPEHGDERVNVDVLVVLSLLVECDQAAVEFQNDCLDVGLPEQRLALASVRVPARADRARLRLELVLCPATGDLAELSVLGAVLEPGDAVRRRLWRSVDLLQLSEARETPPVVVLEEVEKPAAAAPLVALLGAVGALDRFLWRNPGVAVRVLAGVRSRGSLGVGDGHGYGTALAINEDQKSHQRDGACT